MSGRDYRDDVIKALAASEAELIERVEALAERAGFAEADRDAFRLVAVQAIHQLHDAQSALAKLTDQYHRSLEHARELRASIPTATSDQAAA